MSTRGMEAGWVVFILQSQSYCLCALSLEPSGISFRYWLWLTLVPQLLRLEGPDITALANNASHPGKKGDVELAPSVWVHEKCIMPEFQWMEAADSTQRKKWPRRCRLVELHHRTPWRSKTRQMSSPEQKEIHERRMDVFMKVPVDKRMLIGRLSFLSKLKKCLAKNK